MIRQALISVSDKTGVIDLARTLTKMNIKILSTGGTSKLLINNNIQVTDVSSYTNFPEMLDGRVKTLHPKIHGGILARREVITDIDTLTKYQIPTIDIVVVNLYPFQEVIKKKECDLNLALENIDIGGPAMLRSSAKNYTDVLVICDPKDYGVVISEMSQNNGLVSIETRFFLAKKVFSYTADYDSAISNYFKSTGKNNDNTNLLSFPKYLNFNLEKTQDMRYGENPHQHASFYKISGGGEDTFSNYKQFQGKKLSFNNIVDADVAWGIVNSFDKIACSIIKHANPCGVAIGINPKQAYLKALETDPVSSFGGIIAFNSEVDSNVAKEILKIFVEVIVAPSFDSKALKIFSSKNNLRIIKLTQKPQNTNYDLKHVRGGILLQEQDTKKITASDLKIVTKIKPSTEQIQDMIFAFLVAKYVKSNAIVFCKDGMTLGIGAGQMSRVDSARIASLKALKYGKSLEMSVVASDAFFPFRDGIDEIISSGAKAVVQPGGSIRDDEVICAADENEVVMAFSGVRNFRH